MPIGSRPAILLVEDDDSVRALLYRGLRDAGYEVLEARHALEALAVVGSRSVPVDLVVTDIKMPGFDGLQLIERLRSRHRELAAVVISADPSFAPVIGTLQATSTAFLVKPFAASELVATVERLLHGPKRPEPGENHSMAAGSGEEVITVLLVDDDEDSRIINSRMLEAAGIKVLLAVDGPAGVAAAREHSPDAILLDVAMPGMGGQEALEILRSDPATMKTPILAITAQLSTHARGQLEAAGFDAVLIKPVMPNAIAAAVRQALESARSSD